MCLPHWAAFHFASTASLPQALFPGFPCMAGHPEVAPGRKMGEDNVSYPRCGAAGCQGVPPGHSLLCLSEAAMALAPLGFLTSQTAVITHVLLDSGKD